TAGEKKQLLKGRIVIRYLNYDWRLNRIPQRSGEPSETSRGALLNFLPGRIPTSLMVNKERR
ncbi:MAG: hypothetical protein ACWGOX_10980, partial [Desulforhopalus sp.]